MWCLKMEYNKQCSVCNGFFISKVKSKKYCCKICHSKAAREISKLNNIINPRLSVYCAIRFEIFERDNFCCVYCGRSSIKDGVVLELEHISPVSENCIFDLRKILREHLATACRECNAGKTNKVLSKDLFEEIVFELKQRKWSLFKNCAEAVTKGEAVAK